MIQAEILKDKQGNIRGFSILNHGESKACAAVSMLAINTVNSIESFTEDDIMYEYDEKSGGYLKFALSEGTPSEGTEVLLKALELGLTHVKELHPEEISLEILSEVSLEISLEGSEKND